MQMDIQEIIVRINLGCDDKYCQVLSSSLNT